LSGTAILAEDLHKRFGETKALDGLDLKAEEGTVLGVLGPNGAGKTTAVRILATLMEPDQGRATVAGFDVAKDAQALRAQIGLAGQYAAVDENLTGKENLEMVGRLYHMGKAPSRERADQLIEYFELGFAADRMVKTYSGGMRRRLDLAAAMVARPAVLFLDEPTTGLDPRSRNQMWETIEARVAAGTTVLLTTQYLDEADRLADRIAVVDHGKVIAEGTPADLKARVGGERLEVTLADDCDPEAAVSALAPMSDGERPAVSERILSMPLQRRKGEIAEAVRRLDEAGVGIEDIGVHEPTLDDAFFSLTGRPAEEKADEEGESGEEEAA